MAGGWRPAVLAGAVLLGGLAATLLVAQQDPVHRWDGLLIIAVMLVGTALHRADHGLLRWWQAGLVAAVVAVALLVNWFAELASLDALDPRYVTRAVVTLLVIGGAFAIGRLTRDRRTPRWLARVGVLSYSIYLVHYVVLDALRPELTALGNRLPALAEVPVVAAYLGLVGGISWLTYRFVELPGQRLGRRAGRPTGARAGGPTRPLIRYGRSAPQER